MVSCQKKNMKLLQINCALVHVTPQFPPLCTASLNPEFQNHNDTSAYLRSHFGLNFNWTQHFFQGFFLHKFCLNVKCLVYNLHIFAKMGVSRTKFKVILKMVIWTKFLISSKIGIFGTP